VVVKCQPDARALLGTQRLERKILCQRRLWRDILSELNVPGMCRSGGARAGAPPPGVRSRQLRGLVGLQEAVTGSLLRLCARYGRGGLRGRLTIRGAGTGLLKMANGVIEPCLGE